MKKFILSTYLLSSVAYATCFQSPKTVCFADKKLDLEMSYTMGGCSPPGCPVTYFSNMQVSSISDPSKALQIEKPLGPRDIILTQSLVGIIPLKPESSLESLLVIQKDINGYLLTLKSEALPELNTAINVNIKSYKCENVKLKWGRRGTAPTGPRRIEM